MLTDAQVERFSRHILLREVGGRGQERLLAAGVRLARMDEAGRACALWLVRAGVGALDLPEDRSFAPGIDSTGLLEASDEGRPMVEAVKERLGFHGAVRFEPCARLVDAGENAEAGVRAALEAVRRILAEGA